MAQSYLIFDFGGNEEVAQRARHRLENWRQAFRLGNKLQLKFDRGDADEKEAKPGKEKGEKDAAERVRMIVRLDFSDHEKLSHQRWLERIPTEEPFKDATPQVVRAGDAAYAETEKLYEELERKSKQAGKEIRK